MEHILYWLWLSGIIGTGTKECLRLIERMGSIEAFYNSTDYPRNLGVRKLEKLKNKDLTWAKKVYDTATINGIDIIVYDSQDYPSLLKNIFSPPLLLYAKGIIPEWNKLLCIGVVGTRKCSDYGQRVTKRICTELCEKGVTIVSGLAQGIDSIASSAAVESNEYSIVVLGEGICSNFWGERKKLMEKIIDNGLVISEYPPMMHGARWTFPKRNRIIAGISEGIIIAEAPEKSGALITAQFACDENRDIFAIPGRIDDINSKGVNNLIQQGAKPVLKADDVLCEYNYTYTVPVKKEPEHNFEGVTKTGLEGNILKALTTGDKHIDELVRELDIPVSEVNTAIMMLEMEQYIKRGAGNILHRVK